MRTMQSSVLETDADWLETEGLGGTSNEEHKKLCKRRFCTRCYWIDKHDVLKEKVGDWVDYKLDVAS